MRTIGLLRAAATRAADEVLVKDFACARKVTLNRERALNSMNLGMVQLLHKAIIDEPHPSPSAVYVLTGAGTKSFCAGGDVREQTEDLTSETIGRWSYLQYQTDYHILITSSTFVSLLNGFVMGGCAGMAFNCRYRVASEKALFAMPECTIGFFPNSGMSWLLPRTAINGCGLYLGLTGGRVKGADTVHAGLATHFVPSASIPQLEEQLCNIADPLTASDCLASFAAKELPPFSLEPHLPLLERAFALTDSTTVEGILDALKSDGSEFALATARTMEACSPTALKVTLAQQRATLAMKQPLEALEMEIFAAQRMLEETDIREGVRALLVDKTKDPKWSPATLAEVTEERVQSFFGKQKKGFYAFDPTKPLQRIYLFPPTAPQTN